MSLSTLSKSDTPTLCMIHEAVSRDSAIAKVALLQTRLAVAAGWRVSVVAKFLDPSLRESVEWIPLTVPPRGFILQWTTARYFIRRAIGKRTFDLIHTHQPQVANVADIFSCHFLTRVAYERKCLERRPGWRPKLTRFQQQGVLYAEDRCFRGFNPSTHVLFCSEMIRDDFSRLYGRPASEEVLINPCPPVNFPDPARRAAARKSLVGDFPGLVVGYLGGCQERKGYQRLVPAVAADKDLFLLMAGPYSEGFWEPRLSGRMRVHGLVDDLESFYAACDVLAVPSLFEPLGLVALEAAAQGVPVIATEEVGALTHLLRHKAGAKWNPAEPIGPLVRRLVENRPAVQAGARGLADELSAECYSKRLLSAYDRALSAKQMARATSVPVKSIDRKPTLCIIHEAISQDSGIAKAALWQTNCALAAGWDVTVVAKFLDPSLHDRVKWLRLTVPPRLFLLKWTTARHFIRQALGGRNFDVIHAHQPQVADISDVFHCHFLTRVAHEKNCLENRPGLRPRLIRLQQHGVLYAEDRCYRRWNPSTHMLFCSELIRREFARLYGLPPSQEVLIPACPPAKDISDADRLAARRKLIGDKPGLLLGYLGGLHERKGYKRLIAPVVADPELRLMIVGAYSQGFSVPEAGDRIQGLGFVEDVNAFYAACDVFVVPSLFDPLPAAAFEAAAQGVPVIATDEVGALQHILEFSAGARWSPDKPLGPLVRRLIADRQAIRAGGRRLVETFSEENQSRRLLAVYDQILHAKAAHRSGRPVLQVN